MFYKTSEAHGLPHDPFKSCIAPRPIAWVTSLSPSGQLNLAPFSFFNGIASDPPMIMISFTGYHQHGGEKDTLYNIKATREFVINIVPLELKDLMNATQAPVAHDVDEMEMAGLTPTPATLVDPPRVAEVPIHLECVFIREVELPCSLEDSINTMIIAEVAGIHIDDEVLTDGLVDLNKIKPIARLGYQQYTVVDNIFQMTRPKKG